MSTRTRRLLSLKTQEKVSDLKVRVGRVAVRRHTTWQGPRRPVSSAVVESTCRPRRRSSVWDVGRMQQLEAAWGVRITLRKDASRQDLYGKDALINWPNFQARHLPWHVAAHWAHDPWNTHTPVCVYSLHLVNAANLGSTVAFLLQKISRKAQPSRKAGISLMMQHKDLPNVTFRVLYHKWKTSKLNPSFWTFKFLKF